MLGLGKTSTVRASATVDSALSQDIYQHYAAALYRQALLAVDDPALAEHAVCDVLVNERALAALPGSSAGHGRALARSTAPADSLIDRCRRGRRSRMRPAAGGQ